MVYKLYFNKKMERILKSKKKKERNKKQCENEISDPKKTLSKLIKPKTFTFQETSNLQFYMQGAWKSPLSPNYK